MKRNYGAYSVHSFEELEAARDSQRQAMLDEQAIHRIATKKTEFYARLGNVQTSCVELLELVDELNSGKPEHRGVDTRSLSERLRLVENELLAATDALADQLGLVATAS